MGLDKWYVEFVAADSKQRNKMLDGKTKNELIKICKTFRLNFQGNTVVLKNRLCNTYFRLPI